MRCLQLIEGAPAEVVDLTDDEALAVADAEIADLTRAPGAAGWSVSAGRKIGVVQVGDLEIIVAPKLPVERLVFLMGYATSPSFWREHSVHLDPEANLPEALAHAFARLARQATEQGLIQGYRSVEESLPVLRGRIRVADQISRRFGASLPLEVSYDDFTVDIPENQILLAAATRLLRVPRLGIRARQALQRQRLQLAGVTELHRGVELPRWHPSRLNARYVPALRLAERILAGESFEQRKGDLRVSGFVFDMWKIYEDFVGVALSEALGSRGTASLQHRMHLDRAGRVDLRPDFLWTGHDRRRFVVDAKYKAEKPAGYPQADLYQLLAYCTVLGLRDGHLVYAKGNEAEVVHEVRGSDVSIHCHTLDLDKPPQGLLAQIDALVGQLLAGSSLATASQY